MIDEKKSVDERVEHYKTLIKAHNKIIPSARETVACNSAGPLQPLILRNFWEHPGSETSVRISPALCMYLWREPPRNREPVLFITCQHRHTPNNTQISKLQIKNYSPMRESNPLRIEPKYTTSNFNGRFHELINSPLKCAM